MRVIKRIVLLFFYLITYHSLHAQKPKQYVGVKLGLARSAINIESEYYDVSSTFNIGFYNIMGHIGFTYGHYLTERLIVETGVEMRRFNIRYKVYGLEDRVADGNVSVDIDIPYTHIPLNFKYVYPLKVQDNTRLSFYSSLGIGIGFLKIRDYHYKYDPNWYLGDEFKDRTNGGARRYFPRRSTNYFIESSIGLELEKRRSKAKFSKYGVELSVCQGLTIFAEEHLYSFLTRELVKVSTRASHYRIMFTYSVPLSNILLNEAGRRALKESGVNSKYYMF